jgi:hypothetical protein
MVRISVPATTGPGYRMAFAFRRLVDESRTSGPGSGSGQELR